MNSFHYHPNIVINQICNFAYNFEKVVYGLWELPQKYFYKQTNILDEVFDKYYGNIQYHSHDKALKVGWDNPNPTLSSLEIYQAKQIKNLEKLRVEFCGLRTSSNYLISSTIEIIKNNPELKTLILDLEYIKYDSISSIINIYKQIPKTKIEKFIVLFSDSKLPDDLIISKKDFTDKLFQESPNLIYFINYSPKNNFYNYFDKRKFFRKEFKYFNTFVQLAHLPHEINSIILSCLVDKSTIKWTEFVGEYRFIKERIFPVNYFEVIDSFDES